MRARFRSWWQYIRKPLVAVGIIVVCTLGIALIVGIFGGYVFNWNWTGLGPYISPPHPKDSDFQRGKTLWDWLQLLIIPLVLAVGALLFNLATTRTEQKIATQRYEQDQKIALDKQREDLLQVYLDRMSELLLKEKLRSSEVDTEARNVARVRTITILFQLDARRIGYVFAFLREAGLMSTTPNDSIISLNNAKLEKINFSQADLRQANLSEADLSEADLSEARLRDANLSEADLDKANLSGASLIAANLSGATLSGANLIAASLIAADLSGANLSRANLSRATLSGANLSEANLSNATLIDARVTEEQLKKAKSLKGATMPDGSIHP